MARTARLGARDGDPFEVLADGLDAVIVEAIDAASPERLIDDETGLLEEPEVA